MKHVLFRYTFGAAIALAWIMTLAMIVGTTTIAAPQAQDNPASAPTPKLPDGHPDLSGFWGGGAGGGDGEGGGGAKVDEKGNLRELTPARGCHPGMKICAPAVNQSNDSTFVGRMDSNRPVYKPEFWDRVQYLDANTNSEDPLFTCQPYGVPRMGPPTKIIQKGDEATFLYAQGGAASAPQDFRVIPTNNPKRDPLRSEDLTYYGYPIGRWEGDTLVVESIAFNDITWIKSGGYFHSNNMKVVEKFTRVGNTLKYEVTVIDPDVLLQPWEMTPRTLRLNTKANAYIPEGLPCQELDQKYLVGQTHH